MHRFLIVAFTSLVSFGAAAAPLSTAEKIVTTKATLQAIERVWPKGEVEQFIVTKAQ